MFDPWPFATVPDRERARIWAGRPDTKRRLDALMAAWQRRRASEISVLWADFGQGKTHSLLYLQNNVLQVSRTVSVHYVQLPPLTAGSPFVALFRQLMRDFPIEELGRRVYFHYQHSPMALLKDGHIADRTIIQLLWVVGTNGPGKETALRWLKGDSVTPAGLSSLQVGGRPLALGQPPRTAQDCQNLLDSLLKIAIDFPAPGTGEVVLLIDEFQRVGELSPRKRAEVCDALHLIFNSHPQGLRMVLAFAGGLAAIVSHVLTPDLQHRVSTRLDLPPMSPAEGREYIDSLLRAYEDSPTKPVPDLDLPYSDDALDHVLRLADPMRTGLSPRRINITCDVLTNEVLTSRESQLEGPWLPITLSEIKAANARAGQDLVMALGEIE